MRPQDVVNRNKRAVNKEETVQILKTIIGPLDYRFRDLWDKRSNPFGVLDEIGLGEMAGRNMTLQ